MNEIFRRVILAVGLLLGLWMVVWPAPHLFRLYPIDWEHERARKEKRGEDAKRIMAPMVGEDMVKDLDLYPETRAETAELIRKSTEGRLITVQGEQWGGFFSAVADTVLGKPPSAEWEARSAKGLYEGSLYFRPDEPPLSSIADRFKDPVTSSYVCVEGPQRQEYLFVSLNPRNEAFRQAPPSIAFPSRHVGTWILLCAFVLYALFPTASMPREGLYYSRFLTGTLPDFMGVIMAGLFFVIPIIVPVDFAGDSPFDPGWNIMTGVCWLLCLLMLSLLAIAAWYMTIRLDVGEEGLAFSRMNVQRSFRWEDIERVEAYERPNIPPWLRKALFLVAMLNWRALGPAFGLSGTQRGFRVILKDGTVLPLLLRGLVGATAFIGQLRSRDIPIEPGVYDALGVEPTDPALAAGFPKPSRGIGRFILFLLAVAGLTWLMAATVPPKDPVVQPAALGAEPFALPKEEDTGITWEILAKEEEILKKMEVVRRKMETITEQMKTAPPEQRTALQDAFSQAMEEFNRLHEEFEAVRKPAAKPEPAPKPEEQTHDFVEPKRP